MLQTADAVIQSRGAMTHKILAHHIAEGHSERARMTLTTGTAGPLLTPEQVESLLIKPVLAASVALNPLCSRVLRPTAPSVRLPAVTADPTAAWVAEGAEIPISDLTTAEVDVVTRKVAGLSVVTSELAEDSSPGGHSRGGPGPGPRHRPQGRRRLLR
jgi:HK97 family phage major capsid protein